MAAANQVENPGLSGGKLGRILASGAIFARRARY
jgi:hypothetical protein